MDAPGRKIESRIWPLLLGLVGLLLFVLAAGYGLHALQEVVDYTDARKQTRQVLLGGREVLSLLKDVETGQRGFLLTGEPAYLAPYDQARSQLPAELASLRKGVTDNIGAHRMDTLDRHIARRLEIAAQILDLRRSRGAEPARQALLVGAGKTSMDKVRAEFARLDAEIGQRLLMLDENVRTTQARARIAGMLLASLGGVLLASAYALLLREQGRRVRAERELGEAAVSEARAREQAEAQRHVVDILESLVDGFVALDRNWRYTYVNAQAGRMFCRDPASLIGKHIWSEFPEGEDQPFAQAYRRVMATLAAEAIEEHYTPWDRWFENRIYPTKDGIAIYFHEITDRKRAEAEAHQRRAELESVFEALPDLFFRLAPDGTILDYRARRDELYIPPEHFLGHRMQEVLPPEAGALFSARLEEQRRRSGPATFEYPLPMPGGERHYEARLNRLPDLDDLIVVVRDVTERVLADRDLRDARDNLRAFATKLDRDIESERRRLAREVHDQLGQIFTALKLQLMACPPGAPLDTAKSAQFDTLLDEGIKVARRISADLRPPMLDDLGLGPALAHYGRLLGTQAGCDVAVDIQRDDRLGPECVNQLFRVAQEALTNVARHAGATRVRINGAVEDGHYLLTVDDDGRGLQPGRENGLGMLGMRERAALIGAQLETRVSPLGGMRLALRLPLIEREDEHAHPAGG